jgi:hypothetical protein
MSAIATSNSLFEIDAELDGLVEQIQEEIEGNGEASEELMARFQQFCQAHGEKVDRIGRFLRMMEAREHFCRAEAVRLGDRARAAAGKVERTKSMVMFHLLSRDLKRLEGAEFTLRIQKNSQDSVRVTDDTAVPLAYCKVDVRVDGVLWETIIANLPGGLAQELEKCIKDRTPDNEAIKAAARCEPVPGAEVRRESHLRVA